MQKAAIQHRMHSEFSHPIDERRVCIRLRSARGDLSRVTLYFGDRACPHTPVPMTACTMERVARGEEADWFESVFEPGWNRICYYFLLEDKAGETAWYFGDRFHEHPQVHRSEWYQIPIINRNDLLQARPDWQGQLMYQIFPDSFACGAGLPPRVSPLAEQDRDARGFPIYRTPWLPDAGQPGSEVALKGPLYSECRHGGTLSGIRENLDWIESLGTGILYLNPIFAAGKYHKYDTMDYRQVDPCLGNAEDLRELVDACHEKGIKVVLDGVFNHCGAEFFAFRDLLERQEASPYRDWFYDIRFPVTMTSPPCYATFAYEAHMPKMNTANPEVIEYFCETGRYWIREFGIDGWRLDVANEIDRPFWRAFRKAVLDEKPGAFLIGEIWEEARSWLLGGDQFDSSMNYQFADTCRSFFAERTLAPSRFAARVSDMLMRYPTALNHLQMNLLDSHDVPRFLHWCRGDLESLSLAAAFQLSFPGIPSVFAGDERAMDGLEEHEYRRPFEWPMEGSVDELKNHRDAMTRWYRRLGTLRRTSEALRRGEFRFLRADDALGVVIFERRCPGERILVALNTGYGEWTWDLPDPYPEDGALLGTMETGPGGMPVLPGRKAELFRMP